MKLGQILETKYADANRPQHQNFSAEKVIEMFFDEVHEDMHEDCRAFTPKDELYIEDDVESNQVEWLTLRNGEWYSIAGYYEGEWHVNPAKFKIDMKRAVYRP